MNKYKLVALGGTFDRLHQGHKDFLNFAFSKSDKVLIGLTSDSFVEQNKPGRGIEKYETRLKNLEHYLESVGRMDSSIIVPIDDIYGPTISEGYEIEALIVTTDSKNSAKMINDKRKEGSLGQLPLEVFNLTKEGGKPISSSGIRKNLQITDALRKELKRPYGRVIDTIPDDIDPSKTVSVGDVTTKNFLSKGISPKLSIVDFRVERKEIKKSEFRNAVNVKNAPGNISSELSDAIEKALDKDLNGVVIVDGEEDLAVLPVILFAPIGFKVFYGQPGQGLVELNVDKSLKKIAQELVDRFEIV